MRGQGGCPAQIEQRWVWPRVIFSNTPGPDSWWRPATSSVNLPWRWPVLSLSYLSPGFFLGKSWQWCHHLVMLLGDLVHRAGSTHFSCTLILNWEKHCWESRRESIETLHKGRPLDLSSDFQILFMISFYPTHFLAVLSLEKPLRKNNAKRDQWDYYFFKCCSRLSQAETMNS